MFASPPRPVKLFLGSGSPCHLLRPSPYIAICSLRVCCASQRLDILHPLAWALAQHDKPQGRGEHRALPRGCAVTHWLWAPCILLVEARGAGLLGMGDLVTGFSHSPVGPFPGDHPLNRTLSREEVHHGAGHLREARCGSLGALGSLAPSRTQAKRWGFWLPTTHPPTRPHGDSCCLLLIPRSVL